MVGQSVVNELVNLPYGEFEWLKDVDELDIMPINKKK